MGTPGPVDLGITGWQLYERTLPLAYADPDNAYAWMRYLGALATILDPVAQIVYTDGAGNAGWTALASPSRCPPAWLPVLAQWAGVRRPDALTQDELRELIGPRAPGMWRGTKAAMIAAVRRFYPPEYDAERFVYFEERADGDPYRLRIFTYSFVPHDPALVQAALEHAKPAGLQLIYEVRDGQTWAQLRDRGTWGDVNDTYADWGAMLRDLRPLQRPEEDSS